MFKKPVEAKSMQRLSGADKKKLRRTTKERFPQASDADIDAILPLKGGEVSRYVIGGADLMFPGISIPPEGLPPFLAGQPWAVKVPGNPAPIAVGTTTMSSAEALKAGLRGKALRITHCYHDSLWESVEGHYVPNAGFLEDVVVEDPALFSVSQLSDASGDASSSLHGDKVIEKGEADSDMHTEKDVDAPQDVDISNETCEEVVAADMSGLKVSDNVRAEESNNEKEQQTISSEEVDFLLDKCLLQALHTSVKDKDLPMPGSTLWSNHILPCRPPGITLDIKKSSHKKLSKWLLAKSSAGLISAKEDKYKKEVMLLAVNHAHQDYMSFRPEKQVVETADQRYDSSVGEVRHAKQQLEVAEIYKPSTHVKPIFTSLGADAGKYYSASEASEIVFSYVEKENLVKPSDKATVVLDAILCDALFKGTIKKGSTYPTEIHKKDLGVTFLNRLQAHHRVSRGNDVAVRKGAIRSIQIMTERRQGNKKVTRVSGLESFLMDAELLASELQKKFACSTSVAELPGKKGQHEVLVQGGVIDDLAKHLVDHHGIPKRYIEVLDKTKK
ncbi:eukaryotic translation initiation factor 2D isoform X2 [Phoenix dactylifera]|uniref:Eukaryotic translation initiation factor 2D isoform X2 n=1 Tax=Phoenix dactylifera TaxID=42345 RepID=A0A8B9ARY2_PHODC|nr:eukaryotic translation initiation factor 2D isoform X2 [Phoenix dactylifera]